MMKKHLSLVLCILCALILCSLLVGCGGGGETTPPEPQECQHDYTEISRIDAQPLKDGEAKYKCSLCEETKTEVIPMTRSLKVLAIGNSFSVDAVTYLWSICNNAGVSDLVIANANIGGCSLDTHADNIKNSTPAYAYAKYTKASAVTQKEVTLDTALEDEDWDFITVQQVSQSTGMPDTFANLDAILAYVGAKCPDAKIYWHMTWAYQQDTTHAGFKNYNSDQATMYQAIVDTTNNTVLAKDAIVGVIPSGTTMQNLRTSSIGDTVTRDGYHASQGVGRYAISLTWYAVFTGGSVDAVRWYPSNDYFNEIILNKDIIREAVENAIKSPFSVTQSQHTGN